MLTPEQERMEEILREQRTLNREYRILKSALKNVCTHPKVESRSEDRDDGYGRWWVHKYKVCDYCGAENHYGEWGYR